MGFPGRQPFKEAAQEDMNRSEAESEVGPEQTAVGEEDTDRASPSTTTVQGGHQHESGGRRLVGVLKFSGCCHVGAAMGIGMADRKDSVALICPIAWE